MSTTEKAAFLMGFGTALGHNLSPNEKKTLGENLVIAQQVLGEGAFNPLSVWEMENYITKLMLKWLVHLEPEVRGEEGE